jgi:ribonuclease E
VSEVTSLGLVQMTRKKIGTGLAEAFTVTCETCQGRGYHRHDVPVLEQAPADGGERHRGKGKNHRKDNGKGGRKGKGDNGHGDKHHGKSKESGHGGKSGAKSGSTEETSAAPAKVGEPDAAPV